jgi:hypothetical protein
MPSRRAMPRPTFSASPNSEASGGRLPEPATGYFLAASKYGFVPEA